MNNKNKDFFITDVETNVTEEDLVLAPPKELFEQAKEIAQNTVPDEKFPFTLHYDALQKDFLLSMLETVGAVVEDDDEEGHMLGTMMNMTQLAFIKGLDCVERVSTDEGKNPFLGEKAQTLEPIQQDRQEMESLGSEEQEIITGVDNATVEAQPEPAAYNVVDENMEVAQITAEDGQAVDGIAVASVAASVESSCSSCCCPTNTSMETAATVSDESYTSGYICCPGAEQWFKFVATRTGQYTICTNGSLDTVGTLYDEQGNQLVRVDDYVPCGKINFRIVCDLTAGETYYIKVGVSKGGVGSYWLRVTDKVLANYVTINKSTITLEKGVTYELPITPNYTYKGYNGAQPIPGLSVSLDPANATEQEIWWNVLGSGVLHYEHNFDEDGDRYIHITAIESGTTKLYAEDWYGNGKRDECTVYVGGEPVPGLKTIKQCRVRKDMSMDDSAILKDSSGANVKLNVGETVPLLSTSTISANGRAWYRILYNGMMLHVTADDNSFEEIDVSMPSIPEGRDIFANPGLDSNINIRSTPFETAGNIIGQFAHGTNLTLTCNTPQNSEWFAVYGKNKNGTYTYGWCSGRYLAYYFLNTIRDCYVRTSMVISSSTILKDSSGKSVVLREDTVDSVRLWKLGKLTGGGYSDYNGNIRNDWYMVEYNGQIAYVTADSFYIFDFGEPLIDEDQDNNLSSDGYIGDYTDFLKILGFRESSSNYSNTSASGIYLGMYQMGPSALAEAGFKDNNGYWTSLAASYGVTSDATFLSSPDAQEYAIRAYHKKIWGYLEYYDYQSILGTTYYGVVVTESGLLAAAHLVGAYGVTNAIKNNTNIQDGLDTPAYEYMDLMKNYDISEIK